MSSKSFNLLSSMIYWSTGCLKERPFLNLFWETRVDGRLDFHGCFNHTIAGSQPAVEVQSSLKPGFSKRLRPALQKGPYFGTPVDDLLIQNEWVTMGVPFILDDLVLVGWLKRPTFSAQPQILFRGFSYHPEFPMGTFWSGSIIIVRVWRSLDL